MAMYPRIGRNLDIVSDRDITGTIAVSEMPDADGVAVLFDWRVLLDCAYTTGDVAAEPAHVGPQSGMDNDLAVTAAINRNAAGAGRYIQIDRTRDFQCAVKGALFGGEKR